MKCQLKMVLSTVELRHKEQQQQSKISLSLDDLYQTKWSGKKLKLLQVRK